jgi:hypothetical protein
VGEDHSVTSDVCSSPALLFVMDGAIVEFCSFDVELEDETV